MLEMGVLLSAAKALLEAAVTLRGIRADKRVRVATLLDSISATLSQIVERRSAGKPAVDLCAELEAYGQGIEDVARGTTSEAQLVRIAAAVSQARISPNAAYQDIPSDEYLKARLDELSEAAGLLKGVSNLLRAA
ncbi:hypothetical protein C7T35_01140 [Variovorax sp. WS11]|uniref:hypothetical protein n=1 Tax=Variovorax sp. WS11 TaxID=1105204 RepID=UPI000D0D4817|nr:hypothetical protein [Variovorax sp. WS11]NDZ11547.1 hypothetical protein [Variovorax sp. WS11]PSL86601.1 hypothetical protein C7T35_01140 [Variovorax sp. WS11]